MESINIKTVKFTNVHYLKIGEGPVVVLVHGFPANGELWELVWAPLSASFSVIIPDIPGSGESTLNGGQVSIDLLAESVEAILEFENKQHAVVVGHSMGGYVTLAFAEKHPQWLRGISLVHSTATADTEEKKQTRRKSIELIRKGGREPFIKGMIPNLFSDDFRELHPDVVQKQIKRGLKLTDDSIIAFYNAMINRPDRTSNLKEANIPVQWIIGKDDQVVPSSLSLSQSRLSTVNFISMYSDCGHMSMIEQPEKLAADLKDFISYCFYENDS